MNSCIYNGVVTHTRFKPVKHFLKYKTFSFYIDLDELKKLDNNNPIFSYNRFNIFSFYDTDHGLRDGSSLKDWVLSNLKKFNVSDKIDTVKLLCYPRIFGYVFNPLSIFYCYENQKLKAIFYEVKNTFNEQHTYIFKIKNEEKILQKCKKKFYVSPFIDIEGYYIFKINDPKKKISVKINQYLNNDSKILFANQIGKRIKFSSYNLMKLFITFPLLTIKVISMIHWQAFKILIKGGKYYKRKPKIRDSKSYEGKLI